MDLDKEETRAAGVGVPTDMRGGPIVLVNRGLVVDGGPIVPVAVADPLTRVLFDSVFMFGLVMLSEDNFLSFVTAVVLSLSELLRTEDGRETEGVENIAESRRETLEDAGVLVVLLVDPPVPRTP